MYTMKRKTKKELNEFKSIMISDIKVDEPFVIDGDEGVYILLYRSVEQIGLDTFLLLQDKNKVVLLNMLPDGMSYVRLEDSDDSLVIKYVKMKVYVYPDEAGCPTSDAN